MYQNMILVVPMSDIGRVYETYISDGVNELPSLAVNIPGFEDTVLLDVGGVFYIDQPHQIKRVTPELAVKFGLENFFGPIKVTIEVPVPKKTRKKKND